MNQGQNGDAIDIQDILDASKPASKIKGTLAPERPPPDKNKTSAKVSDQVISHVSSNSSNSI